MRLKRFGIFLVVVMALLLGGRAAEAAEGARLPVPHIWEIPGGAWVKPWNGACEESSIMMVNGFYLNAPHKIVSRAQSKAFMSPLFAIENKLFGYNADTNATETQKLINDFSSFEATIIRNPTPADITNELLAGRPVISLHYGYDLKNPRHRFRSGGSSYHMMVLTGFDDEKKVFYVNDPELSDGLDFAYNYATIMDSLRDFNHVTKHADGPPTVLFTDRKELVRAEGGKRVYLLRNGTKHHIISPAVFARHRLSLQLIEVISKSELDATPTGPAITE